MLGRPSVRMPLLGQGMRVRHMLVRKVMVVVMVMVKVDGELWHSSRLYVLVWEVMLHHGEPDGVVKEVTVMELVVVMSPKRRERQGPEARERRHRKRTRRRPGQPAIGPIRGHPRCASSSCRRSSCRRQSSRLSRCTPNGTMPAANCA